MKRLLAATETVAAVFLLLIALLTAFNVGLRDLLSIQIPDWFDGSKLLMCIALFWGMAVTTYHSGHICVDALWEHLGAANRRRGFAPMRFADFAAAYRREKTLTPLYPPTD